MMQPRSCPKCSKAMEAGFIVDRAAGGASLQPTWVEGEPTPSFWTGTSVRGRDRMPVTTFRCSGCGYLESFAPEA